MTNINIFQLDAFTDKIFHGNPAAVCLLKDWYNDELMQAIAVENNLSETAFVIENRKGFHIRWFTPRGEVSLCGHATLAAGFVLFELGKCRGNKVIFHSQTGELPVIKNGRQYTLDFPSYESKPSDISEKLASLVNKPLLNAVESQLDYLVLLENEQAVQTAQVDLNALSKLPKRGLILTAPGDEVDFYSRCFYPKLYISEDPVTGSAHCTLAPFWANLLGKTKLSAIQGSFRKGELKCELVEDRVYISGKCKWYMKGSLVI